MEAKLPQREPSVNLTKGLWLPLLASVTYKVYTKPPCLIALICYILHYLHFSQFFLAWFFIFHFEFSLHKCPHLWHFSFLCLLFLYIIIFIKIMVSMLGIEPRFKASKALVLPLDDMLLDEGTGIEPVSLGLQSTV